PVLRAETVARPRLLERLDRALEGAITVVSAPAGFGKSTLLCQWVQRLAARDVAVGWVSLDEHDDDCGRFLEYLVEAVRRMAPDVAPTLPAALRSSPVLPVDLVLSSVVNGFAARDRIAVLVLDDCHCLTAPDVRRFLDEFAAYAPPTLHVVLATRGPLPIDPFRLRARGRLVQVADADLRFSPDETEQFMNGLRRLDLAGAELSALQERTEGWAAGLQLASLSLGERAGRADFIRRFTGTQKDVAGFLLGDVIARLPDDLFGFLMRTAILDRISAPLADAVTGRDDGASMLARVERANLFVIPLDAHGAWVRYHHLFGELLRSLLVERHADEVRILHRRAALWFHAHGSTGDAVQHALAAGDDGLAAELVERCAMPLIMQSHITRVRAWLNALPAALVQARPRLLLAQVWVQFHVSRAREGAATLRHARDAIGRAHGAGEIGADELEALQAELYTLTAGVVSAADRSRSAARLAERWLERVPPAYGFCRGTLGNILGFCHYSLGRLDPA
ncbi:MAG: hypothetical protein KDC48_22415, partial [Planctomycetes bacterium]|nr:hypothetical protein [Planctomycetota bacterium]